MVNHPSHKPEARLAQGKGFCGKSSGGNRRLFSANSEYENVSNACRWQSSAVWLMASASLSVIYDKPDTAGPEFQAFAGTSWTFIWNLRRIEAQRPATFLPICKLAAPAGKGGPALCPSHRWSTMRPWSA
jgi:hypothetical protein